MKYPYKNGLRGAGKPFERKRGEKEEKNLCRGKAKEEKDDKSPLFYAKSARGGFIRLKLRRGLNDAAYTIVYRKNV